MDEHDYTRNPLMEGFVEGTFETSDGVHLRYLHKGEGEPLVMIPGWAATADVFSLNAPALAEDHDVFVLEPRGHGFSEAPDHGARISRLGADLSDFLDYLGVEKADLLGWSMGANVIWSYLDQYGQGRVGRLVFVDESPCLVADPDDDDETVASYGGHRVDLPAFISALRADFPHRRQVLDDYFPRTTVLTQEQLKAAPDGYWELRARFPENPDVADGFLVALMRDHLPHDWRDILHTLRVPTLVFTGDASHVTTPECGRWMSEEIPDCTWVEVSAADLGDHRLMQRGYRAFNADVEAFLAGRPVPRAKGAEPAAAKPAATAPAAGTSVAQDASTASGYNGEPEAPAERKASYMGQLIDIRRVEIGPRTLTATVHVAEGGPVLTSDDPEGTNRVLALLPGVERHACVGDASARFGDVARDTEVAHLLEHVSVELMALTELGGDIARGRTRAADGPREWLVELDCPDDVLTSACLSSAAWVLDWAYSGGADPVPDIEATVSGLVRLVGSLNATEGDAADAPAGEAPSAADGDAVPSAETGVAAGTNEMDDVSDGVTAAPSGDGEDVDADDGRDL
jgi:non-heme chloroperoxidase